MTPPTLEGTDMRPMKFALSLGVMTVIMAGATAARAAGSCTVTADCPHGFVCETYVVDTKPADGCTKDAPCGALEAATTAGACVPATCATSADCGTDMVCHTETTQACSGGSAGACAPNTKCAPLPPIESVCTTHTTSTCTYRWQLPCNADSDCGGAFTCVPATRTSCPSRSGGGATASDGTSGGSGTTGAGGSGVSEGAGTPPAATKPGSATPPDGDVAECTTTTAFPGTCQPTATTCQADSDCPSAWTCADVSGAGNSGGDGAGPVGTGTAPGGSSSGAGGVGGGTSGAPAPTDQPTAVSSDSPPVDPKTAPDLVAPQKACLSPYGDFGRGATPTSNGSPTGGVSGPALPPTGEKSLAAEDSAQAQSSGCAVAAHNVKDGWPAGLALLGLVLASRRRTRR